MNIYIKIFQQKGTRENTISPSTLIHKANCPLNTFHFYFAVNFFSICCGRRKVFFMFTHSKWKQSDKESKITSQKMKESTKKSETQHNNIIQTRINKTKQMSINEHIQISRENVEEKRAMCAEMWIETIFMEMQAMSHTSDSVGVFSLQKMNIFGKFDIAPLSSERFKWFTYVRN